MSVRFFMAFNKLILRLIGKRKCSRVADKYMEKNNDKVGSLFY